MTAATPEPVAVVLALGANLGDALAALTAAVERLADRPGLELVTVSPVASTQPVGGPEQPPYLNAVVLARTTLAPAAVLARAHQVEQAAGRERTVRWGPRTLDVDLIQYGDPPATVRSADPGLTLPHPRAGERAFVLWPWARADPAAVLVDADGRPHPVAVAAERAPDRPGLAPGPAWPAGSLAAALATDRLAAVPPPSAPEVLG
jgi:dihydroneopterin aldolase/2-amino-4-hydroxy-6-hydroxymethyldihydropteridine diphosphokinase